MMALKPHNLEEIRSGGDGGGGGFPGMGGMGGGGGAGGMPSMPQLPGGISPLHIAAGCALAYYLFGKFLNVKLIGFCGAVLFWAYSTQKDTYERAGGGLKGVQAAGKGCVQDIGARVSAVV